MYRILVIAAAFGLTGCVNMVTEYDATTGKAVAKTPASLVAMEKAQGQADECRARVFDAMGRVPLESHTEQGRMMGIILSLINRDSLTLCEEIVARIAAEYNATDRARLQLFGRAIGVGGAVAGGYIMGEALAGIAAAGGSRITATNSNVTTARGIKVGGASGEAAGGSGVAIGSNNGANAYDVGFATGSKSLAVTSPNAPVAYQQDHGTAPNSILLEPNGADDLIIQPAGF